MKIYAILGQTLSGKTTLARDLATITGFEQIVTYTNRPMREGEVNGIDYHFVSSEEIEGGDFFGHRRFYTAYREEPFIYAMKVQDFSVDNGDCIVITDPQGLRELKDRFGSRVISVLIDAEKELILKRAKKRGDSIDEVNRRLSVDKNLFVSGKYFSDIVFNPKVDNMLDTLYHIIRKEDVKNESSSSE